MSADRERVEREVREACDEGAFPRATEIAIRGYGPEILGFLVAMHRTEQDADEVFSIWCERLLRGLPAFGWEASLRTWVYTVARNASANFVRGRRNRARRELAGESDELAAAEQAVRTETRPYLRTEAKDKLAKIRDALPPEDRALLVLRVDKGLEWKDLARVMLGDDRAATEAELSRESQRLRKRFQILKQKLLEAGRREGILGGGDES